MTTTEPPVPIPAATVVLLRPGVRGPEVLLTRRPSSMAFAADLDVFPGGRVDDGDEDERLATRSSRSAEGAAAALGWNVAPGDALAVHFAAIREILEEAGVLFADDPPSADTIETARDRLLGGASLADAFADGDVRFATDRLVPIAHWTTPPFMPRRFSTWFFVADLPAGAEPTFRADEVVGHRWIRPADALDELAGAASRMWVPTASALELLVETGGRNAADVAAAISLGPAEAPSIVAENEVSVRVALGAAGAVPGRTGVAQLVGRRELVVVDPGDPSEAAIDALSAAVARRSGSVTAIVLTRPDPEHAAGAEALAIPLEVPVLVAPGGGRHLPYDTTELADGERLPSDVDVRVRLGPPGSAALELVVGERLAGE